jgi:hypothetical protein
MRGGPKRPMPAWGGHPLNKGLGIERQPTNWSLVNVVARAYLCIM